jgi:hypothetical protein
MLIITLSTTQDNSAGQAPIELLDFLSLNPYRGNGRFWQAQHSNISARQGDV